MAKATQIKHKISNNKTGFIFENCMILLLLLFLCIMLQCTEEFWLKFTNLTQPHCSVSEETIMIHAACPPSKHHCHFFTLLVLCINPLKHSYVYGPVLIHYKCHCVYALDKPLRSLEQQHRCVCVGWWLGMTVF